MGVGRLAGALVLVGLHLAADASAYRGLAECPDLHPSTPPPLAVRPLRACQTALFEAGALFVKEALAAQSACLDRVLAGQITLGNAESSCLLLHRLATGAIVLPRDVATATRIRAAMEGAGETIAGECSDAELAALPACGSDRASSLDCLLRDHVEHTQHVLERVYGDLAVVADPAARACQSTVAAAATQLVLDEQSALAACLAERPPGTGVDDVRRCLGGVRRGSLRAPGDRDTAFALAAAERDFDATVAATCSAEALAPLDACADDLDGLGACLRCAGRREALFLIDGELGGEPPRSVGRPFLDWATLRNPILGLDDRRIKDQALGYHDEEFFLFASQAFADGDPDADTKDHLVFRSRDLRSWSGIPDRIHVDGAPVSSPDLSFIDGVWHLVWQNRDPANPEVDRLYHATSPDLARWSPPIEISENILPGISIIDGALARRGGLWFLVYKYRSLQEPWFSASGEPEVSPFFTPGERFILQVPNVALGGGPGFGENFQLLEIDGQQRLLATARDREGLRCPNLFTCFHEPFLYTLASGDGTQYEDWLAWNHKTQLRIPYESWNPVMHANTGYLNDFRGRDGFFYLTYSGSLDEATFQGRGHGKIGIARSRDLVHWHVAGDLRD